MKRILFFAALVVLIAGTFNQAAAQRLRLRGQITPNCGVTSNFKFADIHADGNIAVQGSYSCRGVFIYDLTNPDAPVLANWYNPAPNQQFLEAIVIGNRGYFGSGVGAGGVHIVDLTNPYQPVLLGVVDSTRGNGHNNVHEMVVWGDYLIENYNLLSSTTKLIKIINISDPANPVFKWDLNPADATWVHAMHIRGNRMYTSGWGGKIEIYDLANVATQPPTLIGTIQGDTTNHSSWTSEDGNYLYSCRETFDGDLRVYDVRDPLQPVLRKSIKAGDLGLNAITPHNPIVMGNYLYVAWYQAGVQVFDITNPIDPIRVGQYDTFQNAFAPSVEEKQAMASAAPLDMMCGAENLQNQIPNSYDGNWTAFPFLGMNKILAGDLSNGLLVLDATEIALLPRNKVADFDGDRKTDLSVFSPASGAWQSEASSNGGFNTLFWGLSDDIPVSGDFDGDGKIDAAVWRPSDGAWYISGSTNGFRSAYFGTNGDVPVPADYDADGKTDLAVFRPSTGAWYIQQSTLGFRALFWGTAGDKALAGDFDGDGKADIAIWRPSIGLWCVLPSSSSIPMYAAWGQNGDKPLTGDFDGDGRTDFTVFRPSEGAWYILNSSTSLLSAYLFGSQDDLPIPADFDGDGKADIAVFSPDDNAWYRLNSSNGQFVGRYFGKAGDRPSPLSTQAQ